MWGNSKMRVLGIVAVSIALAGCASEPKTLWLRTDGQRATDNPVFKTQFELDGTACLEERKNAHQSSMTLASGGLASIAAAIDRSSATDTVQQGCMAEKGYLLVPEDQALAKQAELTAAAAEAEQKRQQEAAQAANPPPRKRPTRKTKPAT